MLSQPDPEGRVLKCLGKLKEVLHYSTICKAVKRLRKDLNRLLEESSKLLGIKLKVLTREDNFGWRH